MLSKPQFYYFDFESELERVKVTFSPCILKIRDYMIQMNGKSLKWSDDMITHNTKYNSSQ